MSLIIAESMVASQLTELELAQLGIAHHLYVDGWQMESFYKDILNGNSDFGIHVLVINDIPLASCIINKEECFINVFVKEEFRGKKYGKQVISELLLKYNKKITDVYGTEGIQGSEKFYNSCRIAYFKNACFELKKEELDLVVKKEITLAEIKNRRINEYNVKHYAQ